MNGEKSTIYEFDNFRLDVGERQLLRDGEPVVLSSKAFDLLLFLIENRGHLLTKEEIYNQIWSNQIVEESNLTVQISAIRKALGESREKPHYIGTVIGKGYRFTAYIVDKTEGNTEKRREDETKFVSPNFSGSPFHFFTFSKILFAVGILFAVLAGVWLYRYNWKPSENRFPSQQINLARVTNSGRIDGAAISPDGKYAAFVLNENEGNSLWLRQIGTASDVRLLPPAKVEFWGATFSPDGKFIYYNLFAGDKIDFELFRIPSLGGVAEKIPNVSTRAITFSPDGTRIAFIQSISGLGFNSLVVAEADGKNPQTLVKKDYPNTFFTEGQAVVWSPDGKIIAGLVNQTDTETNYFSIVGINPIDGKETLLSKQHWFEVSGIEWLKKDNSLLISAKEKVSSRTQIWLLPFPNGEPRQITNDFNQYSWLSISSDGESLAAIQTNTINSIFVGETGRNDFKEILSEVGELNPLVWTPDGKIVFRSNKDGISNLWRMNADGSELVQLTINAQVDFRGLCISHDGKYLVFSSWRQGKSNLWRVNADGGDLKQLTNGEADAFPNCLPDNQNIVFQRGIFSKPMLWKVSLEGGEATQLTDFRAKWSAISTDGSRLSFFQMSAEKWQIGVITTDGKTELNRLNAPPNLKGSKTQWALDNQSLFHVQAVGNVGNLWKLPLDGLPPEPVTDFKTHWLDDFSIYPDGKRLALTRSLTLSDVVLIKNFR